MAVEKIMFLGDVFFGSINKIITDAEKETDQFVYVIKYTDGTTLIKPKVKKISNEVCVNDSFDVVKNILIEKQRNKIEEISNRLEYQKEKLCELELIKEPK